MKRIITLLIVILISSFASAQITKKINQEFETTKADKISSIHKKGIKDAKNRNYKASILNKTTTADSKTLDSILIEEWDDEFNIWRPSSKQEFTYDGVNIELTISFIWNGVTSTLDPFIKDEYTFDSNGNLSSQMRSFQYTPNTWEFFSKTDYTHDSNGNLILEENYKWNYMNQWENTLKNELTYNTNQKVVLDIGYKWDLGINDWINLSMDEYFYTDPLMPYEINSYWNDGISDWVLNSKWEYIIDPSTTLLNSEISFRRNMNNTAWVNESKYEYQYDLGTSSLLVPIRETGYTWNSDMNQWEYDYRDDYQYDNNNNRTIGTYYDWIETPGEWAPYYKDEFIFDFAYDFNDLIGPFSYDDELDDTLHAFNNMVIGYRGYEYVNLVFVDNMKMLFYYSNYSNPLGVTDDVLINDLKVYPNPTSNILVIESEIAIDKVEIYSILGKKVKEFNSNFDAIPVYDISAGIYIVKIQSNNNVMIKKIIKNK